MKLNIGLPCGSELSAKASVPRADDVVLRDRLFQRLELDRPGKATWIHGAAGLGKTTLAASFLETRQFYHLWYRLDSGDGDLAAFLEKVAQQFAAIAGMRSLDDRPLPTPGPLAGNALIPFSRAFFRELYSRVKAPFVWVFDETDTLPAGGLTLAALAVACEETPAGCRLILIGRQAPTPAMARLEINGLLERIGPDDLAFNLEETTALLARHGQQADPARAAAVHERTRGWVAAIRLTPRDDSVDSPAAWTQARDQQRLLDDYFDSEVLAQIPPGLHDDLMTVAEVDSLTGDLLEGLSGSVALIPLLERLADDKFFVDRLSAARPAFRFHPLFRTFLLERRRRTWPHERIRHLQQRAAEQLIACQRPDEAVALLREAGDFESVCRLIRQYGPAMSAHGQFVRLGDWLAMLPADVRDGDPWMIHWDGAQRLYTDPGAAKARFAAAHGAFETRGEATGIALSWSGYVEAVFNEYAVLSQLDPWLDRFDARIAPLLPRLAPEVAGRVVVGRFMALVFRRPDDPALPGLTTQVGQLAERIGDPAVAALIRCQLFLRTLWSGNLAGARVELTALQELAARHDASALTRLFATLNAATLHLFTGDLAACEATVEEALSLAGQTGLRLWDAVLHGHRISALLALGKPEQAEACLPALRQSQLHDRHSEISRYFGLAGWFAATRPARDDALHYLALSEREVDLGGIPMFQAIARLLIADARSQLDADDPAIESALSQALAIGQRIGNPMLEWIARTASVGHRARGDGDNVPLDEIARAFSMGAKNDYRHFICWPKTMIGRACELALRHGIERTYVQRLIRFNRIAPSAAAAVLDDWPWPVRIRTFGKFSIQVNGEPPPSGRKQRKMPLRLLQRLVAAGGRAVGEQTICDALWPESEGDKAIENLGITLFRLRELLQIDCIERKGGQLSLDDRMAWVDVWALERAVREQSASRALTPAQIEALYQGAFLQHEEDLPWAIAPRQRLRDDLAAYVVRQVTAHLQQNRYDDAEAYCRCGLLVDDEVETFYRGIMQGRLAAGDVETAVRTYRHCESLLRSRHGMAPGGPTREVYRQALAQR